MPLQSSVRALKKPLRLDDEVMKAGAAAKAKAAISAKRESSAARKPAPASGGGALADAMRRAGERSGKGGK